jgi:endogenous inhibitor of DNA gyrase (YacG/DUF329 family)
VSRIVVKRIKIKCLICKKLMFVKKSEKRKYCSRKCYYISKLNKPSWNKGTGVNEHYIKCVFCSKRIFIKYAKSKRKFCSVKCARSVKRPWRVKTKLFGNCKRCGNKFQIKGDRSGNYCSRECWRIDTKESRSKKSREAAKKNWGKVKERSRKTKEKKFKNFKW